MFNKTKQICKENNIKPVRSRGQNFLINEDVYDFIVNAAEIKKDDIILEVGPGLGFLTEKLARKVKRVIAVELDDKLANLLKVNLKEKKIDNVEVVNGNILDFRIKNRIKNQESRIKDNNQNYDRSSLDSLFFILNSKYKIVANLPYNITSVFLRKFLSCENKPKSMVLMLQKEVADRIVAGPGKMSLLAVSVQFYAKAEIIKYVPKIDFWPVPKVDSAVIQLRIKNEEL
ncbi:MAG: 16S rRNA (adenine(1518)-N(6)/adenine(1519)-N(6))-dimethyltransferase RsmA, partial [Patescibacteria group bacterium]|nr:16S rRNA (adenine(1518)-N(6)/adenine(1519)-N(6))-dimethyltransferase RsmA [Patescibacteria group bacterium]